MVDGSNQPKNVLQYHVPELRQGSVLERYWWLQLLVGAAGWWIVMILTLMGMAWAGAKDGTLLYLVVLVVLVLLIARDMARRHQLPGLIMGILLGMVSSCFAGCALASLAGI